MVALLASLTAPISCLGTGLSRSGPAATGVFGLSNPGEDSHRSLRLVQARSGQPRESSACPGQVRTATGVFGLSRPGQDSHRCLRLVQARPEHPQGSSACPCQDSHRSLRHVQVRTATEVRLVKSGQPQESDLLSQDSHRSLRLVQVRTATEVRLVKSGQPHESDLLSQDSHRSLRLVQVKTITGVRHVQVRTATGFFEGGCRIQTSFRPLLASIHIIG